MIRLDGHRLIRTSPQKLFQLVGRLEASPRVTGLWLTADLLERRANALTIHYRGYLAGIPIESVQHTHLVPPHRIEFRQTRGTLRTFRGSYSFTPVDGDTDLALSVEADVGIALLTEMAARRVLHTFVEQTLDKFKLTAERELPRLIRKTKPIPGAVATPPPSTVEPAAPPPPPPAVAPVPSSSQPEQGRKRRRRRRRRRRGPGEAMRGTGLGPAAAPPSSPSGTPTTPGTPT